ncbi:TPA: aconitase X [Pseudomonas aeruginosa]|nr:DUF521 domain-containing protein [Pseudomonas aeruginosa]
MKHAHLIVPRTLVAGSASGELLYAPTGLSFWGGVDPRSAEVIDRHHPLSGRHLHGRLLAIPGGRGSCTGSSVLLELILGGRAPAAILLREPDEILALGAIVAEELFGRSLPIACLGERFDELAAYPWARLADGRLELHRDAPPPLEARPAEALATDAGPRLDGCHLDEQRQARVLIEVEDLGSVDDAFYPTLGYLCGLLCDGQIPAIDGLRQRQPDHDALKAFGAALGTSSSVPMFHVIGVTPEAPDLASAFGGRAPRRTLRVGRERLRDAWRELDSAGETRIDLVALGNPHFSASEFAQLAALCHGRRRHPEVALVITSSRQVVAQAEAAGHLATLQAFGARLVTDTCWCMLDEPLVPPGARTLMTNSAKYAHYAPGLVGRQVRFAGLAGCVEAAVGGRAPAGLPAWLSEDC